MRDDLPPALLSKLHRRVIPALWLGFAFNVINRSNLAFAAIEMAPALGLSQADTGFAAGVFFMGYAGMQVPSNWLMVDVGGRRVLSTCLVAWGVLSSATGLVSDASGLFLLRFLLGLAQSGYYSGCMLLLSGFFPTRELASTCKVPPGWCHRSAPWPPGDDAPGSRGAAQGTMGGRSAAVRRGRGRGVQRSNPDPNPNPNPGPGPPTRSPSS